MAKSGQFLAGVKRVIDWLLTRHDLETRRIASSILAGTSLSIALSATVTKIEHGLGRAWRGWRVIDVNANVAIYRDTTTPVPDTAKYLPLRASGPCNAVIEVW